MITRFTPENPPTGEELDQALEYSRFILKYREIFDSSLVTQAIVLKSNEAKWRERMKTNQKQLLEESMKRYLSFMVESFFWGKYLEEKCQGKSNKPWKSPRRCQAQYVSKVTDDMHMTKQRFAPRSGVMSCIWISINSKNRWTLKILMANLQDFDTHVPRRMKTSFRTKWCERD